MRKKIVFGMIALLALAAVVGERYFNRAVGQDIPLPKAPEAEKKDLFEALKKDLETKKDEPATLPALAPLKKDEPTAPPTLPSLPASKDEKVLITPPSPVGDAPKPMIPRVVSEKPVEAQKQDVTVPPLGGKKDGAKGIAELPGFPDPKKSAGGPTFSPLANGGEKQPPLPRIIEGGDNFPQLDPLKKSGGLPLPSPAKDPIMSDVKSNTAPQAVTLPKNSPWSLNVVLVDGQTIVTAVVNKKHEFKILCQTLDLQTGKGKLKASGKVQINGDALNGTCENLTISLLEDRLLLQGASLVSIDRTSANVSDTALASFELKGDTIDLRISTLQTGASQEQRPVDAQRASRNDFTPSRIVTASMRLDGTQWTPYGRLRAVKSNDTMWSLESSNGAVIAYLLAREGGSLERYVGQSISVYGTREREHAGQPVLRVTHIALP